MQVVRDTDPATIALAESAVARRARDGQWSRAELVDVLEHLGLRAPVKPSAGKTNPVGKNTTPETQRKRAEAKKAARQAAAERKRKEAS